ncbi:hypothetical protein H696_06131 [Fonticula alba]|uniref:Uncharacterized protein n=1 Tax=Fonticula alba TaxID=691883 RepID=A0A058YZZ5_FONAL|nr:hypothetical protein H696_06131 [Fonticula alba]KCV67436.1 hypothetical protein H696_06131 [Fonticula alba]|eukprot:XP_009498163.1 hypothetical protein H696_06131 [Fonticula alba]
MAGTCHPCHELGVVLSGADRRPARYLTRPAALGSLMLAKRKRAVRWPARWRPGGTLADVATDVEAGPGGPGARGLSGSTAGPSKVRPPGRCVRLAVREMAVEMGRRLDVLYGMLRRHSPGHFFLALVPEAGSGPEGAGEMYLPVEELADLLEVDLGCILPQLVSSAPRRPGSRCMAPHFARHPAWRAWNG